MIGIFGDIHGDETALRLVLDRLAAEGATELICLGDIVNMFRTRGAQMNEKCTEIVEHLNCLAVMGNHDSVMKSAQEELPESTRSFLASLPFSLPDLPHGMLISHASSINPQSWWNEMKRMHYEDELVYMVKLKPLIRLICLGHRHIPLLIRYNRETDRSEALWNGPVEIGKDAVFKLDFDAFSYLVVCGAVSCPIDSSVRGYVTLFNEKSAVLRMFRCDVPIDSYD